MAANNPTETLDSSTSNWIVRTVRRGDAAIEVSLIANERKRQIYRAVQYSVLAAIVLLTAFVPLTRNLRQGLDDMTLLLVSRIFEFLSDRSQWWLRQGMELALRLALALLIAKFMPQYTVQESILVLRDFGIQLRTVYTNGKSKYQFIDASSVKAIFINEGIQTCDVRYYMAICVAGRKTLILTFESSRPRLPVLSRIFREVHAVMYPAQHTDDDLYSGIKRT